VRAGVHERSEQSAHGTTRGSHGAVLVELPHLDAVPAENRD
jgi:hypothetical protein